MKLPPPAITLPARESQGQRAIDLLGLRLPALAAYYGKSADTFRQMLLHDETLRLDRKGRLFVVEELSGPLPRPAPVGVIDGRLAPLAQTFRLHSKPDAKRVIALNFKGATLTNTAWNGSNPKIVAPAFDADGNPAAFSDSELQRIQYVWQRVAEDYSPFDVDVTTEALPQDRITRSGAADEYFGTVALITAKAGVYSCSCGGVAYVGVFDDTSDYYKPALIFYDALGSDEKYVAEAISHEVGHNTGLSHDGTSTAGYYSGQGTGATSWAPIMGAGYYSALTQFSKGEYADANNHEDDFAVANGNGLPMRADDHGGTAATATPLAGNIVSGVMQVHAQGVIATQGDADMFQLSAAAGTLKANVVPSKRAPNSDLVLTLMDSAGRKLASRNPVDGVAAGLSYTFATPGTYYLKVTATGKGDPLVTGYTDYGCRGMYQLNANFVPPAAASAPSADSGTDVALVAASIAN